jgi:hypothetical protein
VLGKEGFKTDSYRARERGREGRKGASIIERIEVGYYLA